MKAHTEDRLLEFASWLLGILLVAAVSVALSVWASATRAEALLIFIGLQISWKLK